MDDGVTQYNYSLYAAWAASYIMVFTGMSQRKDWLIRYAERKEEKRGSREGCFDYHLMMTEVQDHQEEYRRCEERIE